jgi:branched-chain amino acid transport system permease protein
MALFSGPLKAYTSLVLIPIWAALLALPFAGVGGAARVLVVSLSALLLWRFLNRGTGRVRPDLPIRELIANLSSARAPLPLLLRWARALFLPLLVILPLFLNDYFRDVMTLTCMYAVLALGLNLVVGQAGLLNLGYVSFYAVGAYTYAILSTAYGVSFWPGLAAGAITAAFFALLVGLPTLRLRGDYFAIVTLGLGEITRIVLNNADTVTGGPNGISNIGRPVVAGYLLHSTLDFYYLILAIAVITVFAMRRLIDSRIGRAWLAIREDTVAAEAMGVDTFRLKLLAFVLGSAWAGLTGVFFAAKMAFVSPESFTFFESVLILCMVVLGGMGSIPGIILAAILLIMLPELFRDFQDYRMLAFGTALVLMMIFRPQGLLGRGRNTS